MGRGSETGVHYVCMLSVLMCAVKVESITAFVAPDDSEGPFESYPLELPGRC